MRELYHSCILRGCGASSVVYLPAFWEMSPGNVLYVAISDPDNPGAMPFRTTVVVRKANSKGSCRIHVPKISGFNIGQIINLVVTLVEESSRKDDA